MTIVRATPPHAPDRAFPALHVRPPRGWVNDPNGPFRHNGRYHLFYQHNPAAPVHGDIHWGHASSADLIEWRTEPVALTPTPGHLDAGGCWSGCVVNDGGVPTAVYTGVGSGTLDAHICLATAGDDELLTWNKHPGAAARAPEGLRLLGYRDPFVFTVEGHRYALVGAGLAGGEAATVLLYRCDDLTRWTYLGPLLTTDDEVAAVHAPADVWECPQLFPLADRWVLIVSLWTDDVLGRVAYLVGDLDVIAGTPRFIPAGGGRVDAGRDFYAPAVLASAARTLLWGWTWEDRDGPEIAAAGWAGALTLPRVLSLDTADQLISSPAPELHLLRDTATIIHDRLGQPVGLPSGALDIEIRLRRLGEGPVTVVLDVGGNPLTLTVEPGARRVLLEREVRDPRRAALAAAGHMSTDTRALDIRLLLDGSVVEVFVSGGSTFTERLYPAGPASSTGLQVNGPRETHAAITVWRLRTAGAP